MPKRTQSHVTADKAVSRVVSIFTDLGWACQTVEHDYGEDVFVQSSVNEQVDPFRLWVQVKGTEDAERLKDKNGNFVWRVSHEHILRWIRSLETVVIVLWDIKQDQGFWIKPHEAFQEWECFFKKRKQASLSFDKTKPFNRDAANALIWKARTGHYSILLNQTKTLELQVEEARQKDPNAYPKFQSRAPTLAIDFLSIIGFLGADGVSPKLRRKVRKLAKSFIVENPKQTQKGAHIQSLILTILALINERCGGVGVPHNLLLELIKASSAAIGVTEAFERGELLDFGNNYLNPAQNRLLIAALNNQSAS